MSTIVRETGETRVRVALAQGARDQGDTASKTGAPFLDHMLVTLARYSGLELRVEAEGDLRHHLIEDVAITVGLALHDEIPGACARYGEATIVMDDALVQVALDLGGRAYYEGPVPGALYDHFFRSLASNAAMTLHVRVVRGRDRHHVVESAFKAFGVALRRALAPGDAVFSTKGSVRLERENDR